MTRTAKEMFEALGYEEQFKNSDIYRNKKDGSNNNPPLKLEELKEETWVWDSEYNEWCYIDFIAGKYIHRKYIDDCISDGEFKENRFYRREVNNDE